MNTRNIIPWSYAISIAAFCLAMYAKVDNSGTMMTMFIIALLLQIVFAIFAVDELRRSEHFTRSEKSNWTGLILCAPLIFGTVYLVKLRKRILYI